MRIQALTSTKVFVMTFLQFPEFALSLGPEIIEPLELGRARFVATTQFYAITCPIQTRRRGQMGKESCDDCKVLFCTTKVASLPVGFPFPKLSLAIQEHPFG
jgi:hypothetical protein